MKKNVLVAIESLGSGGVEVSLIRFLNELSKDRNISIDLFLLKKDEIYLNKIPKNINIIYGDVYNQMYFYDNKFDFINKVRGIDKLKFVFYRSQLAILLKFKLWYLYYKKLLKNVKPLEKKYDLAIDYLGYGHFLTTVIAHKVTATKKIMWIHDEKVDWLNKISNELKYFCKIFAVGKSCLNNAVRIKPEIKNKIDVFYNMSDEKGILKKSEEKINYVFDKSRVNIITVGRLEWQKGYDVALETAKLLKDRKIDFCWIILGNGSLKKQIEDKILEYRLEKNIYLLGVITNPYPYIKKSDIFVLTSRHEGYCLATLEARVLHKSIVATDIESNREQIINGKTGYLCELRPKDFADKIEYLIKNKKQRLKFENNLKLNNFDFSSEFEKLYRIMED